MAVENKQIAIVLPIKRVEGGYKTRHVDVQLTNEEALTLSLIYHGLMESGASLKNGKPISSPNRVIPWILQSMSKSLSQAPATGTGLKQKQK